MATNQANTKNMTLKNAINFFESLTNETNKKSDIKVYQEFIQILTRLELKSLSNNDIQSIETELDNFNLSSNFVNQKKHFKNAIRDFKKYLKDTFSLTPKGYYTTYYGGLGLTFGLLFGVAIFSNLDRSLGISLGLIGGMVIGSIMGQTKDAQVETAGKML